MSFFDEVETTVANTRFLQAIEDHGPITLQLKPIGQLQQLEAATRPKVNIQLLMTPNTTAHYLFKQYLCTQKEEDAVHIISTVEAYRKVAGERRRKAATKFFLDHACINSSSCGTAPSSTPRLVPVSAAGSAYVVPSDGGSTGSNEVKASLVSASSSSSRTRQSSVSISSKQFEPKEHHRQHRESVAITTPAVSSGASRRDPASSNGNEAPAADGCIFVHPVPLDQRNEQQQNAEQGEPLVVDVHANGDATRSSSDGESPTALPPPPANPPGIPAPEDSSSGPEHSLSAERPNQQQQHREEKTTAPAQSHTTQPAASCHTSSPNNSSNASSHPSNLPCLERILSQPITNHSMGLYLLKTWRDDLIAIHTVLAQPAHPPVTLFDSLLSRVTLKLNERVEGFLKSQFFARYVQLEDYSQREPKLNEFRIFRVLGRGAFGAVSAVQKIDTHAVYAMKEMGKKQVKADQSEWMVLNERKVLAKMKSPFVLGLKYSFHEDDTLYLIFDMCAGGDLKFHLRAAKDKCFEPARAKFYAAEVLLGLEHIHSQNICYRDLKPTNILLHQNGHVIISDLGLTIKLRKNKVLKHLAGTAGYWSPEVVSKSGTYKSSDYWSYGVMLYEMLTGKRPQCTCEKKTKQWCPFGQKRQMEDNAIDPEGVLKLDILYPEDRISPDARDFLEKLFIVDPKERLGSTGIDAIKNHPYFKDIDWEAMACLEVEPPFVPDPRTVNANSIGEVGEFNKTPFKSIEITAEDEKMYEGFKYVSPEGVQIELVEALSKMDNPESKNNDGDAKSGDNSAGCCVIL